MTTSFMTCLPMNSVFNPVASVGLIRALGEHCISPELVELNIRADANNMWFGGFIGKDDVELETIETIIHSFYPDALVDLGYRPEFALPAKKRVIQMVRAYQMPQDIVQKPITEIRAAQDPLIALTQAMNVLEEGEILTYKVFLFDVGRWHQPVWAKTITWLIENYERGNNPIAQSLRKAQADKRLEVKRRQILYFVPIVLEMTTPDPQRFHILDTVVASLKYMADDLYPVFDYPKQGTFNLRTRDDYFENDLFILVEKFSQQDKYHSQFVLTAEEVATLWHLPHKEFTAGKLLWVAQQVQTCLPVPLQNLDGIFIGESCGYEVRLPIEERTKHTLIIGKVGMGKSSLMHIMVHADIADGRGVCVVDPHGDLVTHILRYSIPLGRENDVVVVDLSMEVDEVRYPPPLNPIYKVAKDELSHNFIATLRRLEPDFAGTQMEDYLSAALSTLGAEDYPTLQSVRRVIRDEAYRQSLLNQLDDEDLEDEWKDILPSTEKELHKDTRPLLRRVGRFYRKENIRVITCHPDPLNIQQLVSENKIILVNVGGKGNNIPEAERLMLGSQVVAQVKLAAESDKITKEPFMLYIDEAASFLDTNMPLDRMLAQLRKFKLGMVLANQYLSQLVGQTRDAVEGTVGTIFSFEVGHDDERDMLHYMRTFQEGELVNLGAFNAAVYMRDPDGQRQPAFLLNAAPPPSHDMDEDKGRETELRIRRKSVANYTPKSYDDVIASIKGKYDDDTDQSPDDGDGDGYSEEEL